MTRAERRSSKRQEARQRQARQQRRNRLLIIAGVTIAALIVAAFIIIPSLRPPFESTPRPQAVDNTMGDPNAPVKVVEFSDFQCPFCRQFYEEFEPRLISDYIEPGRVHFTYSPFSFLGPESIKSAEASLCAMDQGKFWDYHDILFQNQGGENAGGFSDRNLKLYARDIGLNTSEFNQCYDSGKNTQRVQELNQYARDKGVDATPYFLINDDKLVDRGGLFAAIDEALSQ